MQWLDVTRRTADLLVQSSVPRFVMRGIISAVIYNLSQTIHCALLSVKVELHEKCPPARYMKVWNCRLLFALGLVPQKVFLLLLTERLNFTLMAAAAPDILLHLDCFCFQVTSYLLLQLFQFLRACCMKTEDIAIMRWRLTGSLGNVHKPPQRDNTKETHGNLLTFMLSGRQRACRRPWYNFIKWIII